MSDMRSDLEHLFRAAEQFKMNGGVADVREIGSGNINSTFLVTLKDGEERRFILQRINSRVFKRPELIMQNMRVAAGHISRRLQSGPPVSGLHLEVPRALPAKDGLDYWRDHEGSIWRALSFIEAQSFDTIRNLVHAGEVGHALGVFHSLLSDLPPERLADTLEGFHITPLYLKHYDDVLEGQGMKRSAEVDYCMKFINRRRDLADVLENAKAEGKLRLRPVHGDPKVNNILIDSSSGKAAGIIDLDTVKPGLVHYDIGDCVRSACNPMGEETGNWEEVHFDMEICRALLRGYLSAAGGFLMEHDIAHLYDAIRLISFELGLRFFTDYLEGSVYFKIKSPEHNLARALVQFKLAESIESKEALIRKIIQDSR